MPNLIIDEQEIEVPEGTKVIEAAERLGIVIPRFCYHPALGSVGACRVCAVKFLQGPFKGVQMSCMIDAQDGMVVSTTDEQAVDFRRYVIEWLMLNHPHDCPVCDEGGHCLLQDLTVSGGHGIRRFQGEKRTYRDQYLGPLIQHEMNRCIQCYRCSRFYQEFAGYRDLGVMQIGSRVYFGRQKEGSLQSPFAGNLTDICPTGVYTDKPSRFSGRRWDYERSPSVCINCSLGCRTVVSARYRQIVRQEARLNEAVNGYFICDRGRYGFYYAGQDDRPRQPLIHGKEASWETSLKAVCDELARISDTFGPKAVACSVAARSSLETLTAVKRLCRTMRWQDPAYGMDANIHVKVKNAAAAIDSDLAVSLGELENADYILALGADPVNEAPMLAMAMRQARRKGAKVVLVDPRPVDLPFDFVHFPMAPGAMGHWLAYLLKTLSGPDTPDMPGAATPEHSKGAAPENLHDLWHTDQSAALTKDLFQSSRPIIVCGTDIVTNAVPSLASDLARRLRSMKKTAGLFYLFPGANTFGAAMLSDSDTVFEKILTQIETYEIRALVLVEFDPFFSFPDRIRLEAALQGLDMLVVLDYLDSRSAKTADVFLPTETLYEAGGFFINQEGRAQKVPVAFQGGRPIIQTGAGSHPPRTFSKDIPGHDAKPAWRVLTELERGASGSLDKEIRFELMQWLVDAHSMFSGLLSKGPFPDAGIRIDAGQGAGARVEQDQSDASHPGVESDDDLELITVDWTFGTEELSVRSPFLGQVEKAPCLFLSEKDAARLGFSHGDRVALRSDEGTIEVKLSPAGNMARGTLVLPRHHRLDWQHMKALKIELNKNQILKPHGNA
ncbi:MAG: NADH-quinone oxidoreductase subunit NuoG [Desulfobacterales bacterium]|nr:NADH-quinone oxidoreductase subunit NuoG [Desulfobacterales bacterium]